MAQEIIIIDVREPKEYADFHLMGSINIPSTQYELSKFEPYKGKSIGLICHSGNRAKTVQNKLEKSDFEHVYIMGKQMADLSGYVQNSKSGWSVDRQFRMTLGVLLAIFLGGYFLSIQWLIAIPIILATGLIFTSLIDRCYMRMGIAMLPWNRGKKG
jgi:rhodanese-related sulfurtransferase